MAWKFCVDEWGWNGHIPGTGGMEETGQGFQRWK